MADPEMTANMPADHIVIQFTNLKDLEHTAERVHDSLNKKGDGNQFIIIHGLTKKARKQLDSEERALDGIPYRFMFDNTTGIIKILTYEHDAITINITRQIDLLCLAWGINPIAEFTWGMATTRLLCARSKGKQPDQCLFPNSGTPRDRAAWPTLVVEAGVVGSLPRLREDARWWLRNSQGEVRIAIVLGMHRQRRKLIIKKWQQPAASPQAYAAQTTEISSDTASGTPLVLPFEELFNRPPQGRETDIVLAEEQLRCCMRWAWQLAD
ncbi:uncharacterized protein CDV56_103353 [Aspergillus thermomutatus]|uniref:Uncharacterized protein n=1 Tax=Aspergillus thermomutatus TaxID=41047 RepID=A0A397GKP0_ASPTH|nr:uncharacterized protein CDV56_103353 [Aspergillus thermomutatus]RHZ49643.1 hypothetical protein CDV56_103353 [Aspergillus thermomutatus]